jgi:hypothetical protein
MKIPIEDSDATDASLLIDDKYVFLMLVLTVNSVATRVVLELAT